jgi:hypothetical protein
MITYANAKNREHYSLPIFKNLGDYEFTVHGL